MLGWMVVEDFTDGAPAVGVLDPALVTVYVPYTAVHIASTRSKLQATVKWCPMQHTALTLD